jgi:alpha-galactosidase
LGAFVWALLLVPGAARAKGPVKVFILAGQSNMEGKAAASTLEAAIDDPATRDRFKHLKPDGKWAVRDDVWVTFLDRAESPEGPLHGPLTVGFGSPKRVTNEQGRKVMTQGVGPELGIGWLLGDRFDEPVLLIKAAWGGRAVKQTFRPPSAMPTEDELKQRLAEVKEKNPAMTLDQLRASYGGDYRKIVSETQRVLADIEKYCPQYDEGSGYELAGFIWFQGWNDGVGAGNPAYTEQMSHFIRDIRKDLKAPELPFVIGELGTDGEKAGGWVATFRQQQAAIAALPEFQKNVRLAKTAPYWPTSPDLSQEWAAFRAAAQANEKKPEDDASRVNPREFYQTNWLQKYRKELAYTSDKRYHYLGSGQCYYQMGQSMGQAMLEMIE